MHQMETNSAKSRPHVFKRIMNFSDMQLNVIYLQIIEEFEKILLKIFVNIVIVKTLARIFLRSVCKSLKFRQK